MMAEDTSPRTDSPVGPERLTDREPWKDNVERSKPPVVSGAQEDSAPHGHAGIGGKGSETFAKTKAHFDRDCGGGSGSNRAIWHGKKVLAPLAFALALGMAGLSYAAGLWEGFEPGLTNSTTGQPNPVAPPYTGKEFVPMDTGLPRGAQPQTAGYNFSLLGGGTFTFMATQNALVAKAGGTVSNSTPLKPGLNQVGTVATTADGMLLPACTVAANVGAIVVATNAGANSMTVFAANSELINTTAGATGIAQAAGVTNIYFCEAALHWYKM